MKPLPTFIKESIRKELGEQALTYIEPTAEYYFVSWGFDVFVHFWLFGHECEYYPGTEPLLLRQVETDKEFTSFDQLLEEINGKPIHHTTVRA